MHLPRLRQEPTFRLGSTGPFHLLPCRVPVAERDKHLYVIGTTGTGKSKFLEGLMLDDILASRCIGLIDPHTDLSRDLLRSLLSSGYFNSQAAYQSIVYLDPTRTDYTIPFNVLRSDFAPHVTTEIVLEAFRRTWPTSLSEAPRFENIAQVSLGVLIETKQSLVELPRFLTDRNFREQLLSASTNPDVVNFFHDRFDKWGREGALMIESVLNKVSAFTYNPYIKRMLGARENRLNFRRMMDEGQTLIVDLGKCDGNTRKLLGSLIVTGIEEAARTRSDTPARRPWFLFMDEFQDFCAGPGSVQTLANILSQCRKYQLYLHLAHQTLGQLSDRLISALGNVGIKIALQLEREDAEVIARKFFDPDLEAIKHQANTETQMPLYSPLPEQWEWFISSLKNLKPRRAWVKRRSKPPVLIKTKAIKPYNVSLSDAEQLQAYLSQLHGVPVGEMNQHHASAPTPASLSDWVPAPAPQPRLVYSAG